MNRKARQEGAKDRKEVINNKNFIEQEKETKEKDKRMK